jgi:hypothetical protein
MNLERRLKEATERWIKESSQSDVGLWWIADDVRQLRMGASEEEIRHETLQALRPLLENGQLRAVDLLPGGTYRPWQGSIDEQLDRLDSAWASLGRPPDIGEIVWFIGPRHALG